MKRIISLLLCTLCVVAIGCGKAGDAVTDQPKTPKTYPAVAYDMLQLRSSLYMDIDEFKKTDLGSMFTSIGDTFYIFEPSSIYNSYEYDEMVASATIKYENNQIISVWYKFESPSINDLTSIYYDLKNEISEDLKEYDGEMARFIGEITDSTIISDQETLNVSLEEFIEAQDGECCEEYWFWDTEDIKTTLSITLNDNTFSGSYVTLFFDPLS